MTGSYLTNDGGASWRMFNLGTAATAFAFDPKDPSVIYAAASAIFRSDDRGQTWAMVFPDPARNTVEHGWGDHAETIYTTDDPLYPSGQDVVFHAFGVDASNPARLLVAMQARKPGPPGSSQPETTTVLASGNRGATWTAIGDIPAQRVFALWTEGGDATVRLLAEDGVFVRAGDSWRRGPAPAGIRFDAGSVGRDGGTGATIAYATAVLEAGKAGVGGGLYVSRDSGVNWVEANVGLGELFGDAVGLGETWGPAETSRPRLGPVSASARHGLTAYVGLRGLREKTGDRRPFNGVARTTDGGRTWAVVHRESDRPSSNFEASWIEARAAEDGQSVWLDAPYDLAAAPNDPLVCHVTDLFRTYRTTDGGRTWAQVNSRPAGGDAWVSRGLDVTTHYGVLWDPFDLRRLLVPTTDIGLFRSDDGGASWIGSSTGIPKAWRNTAYWAAFDPDVKGLVWGAFSGTHDLPRPKMWRRTDPADFRGGVAVSTDGGEHWTPSNGGMAESAVTHVIVDPRSPRGQRTLYAAAFGRGVYKSADNGRTWALKNDGLAPDPRRQPFAWRLAQDPAGLLYLVVARRSERGRIGDADDGALYVSSDGADHWTRLPLPQGVNGPNGLAIDPRDPRRLYLSAWAVATPGGDTGGGIFISDDGGRAWRRARADAQHVYDVTIDPRNPDVMYACGFDQAVLRSADRGETWQRVRGFNFKWGHRVAIDPANPATLYVTTFGGGVWRGPATGDPAASEDVRADADPFTVLESQPEPGPRITGFLRHQLDRAWEQDAVRLADWAAVRDEANLEALKRRTRERLLAAIGGLPSEKTPLNARVVGIVEGRGYAIEKVIFESLPGLHVTALLYVPDGPADLRRPAVLLACGHSPDGKAFRNYQEIAVRLVRRGYVVLCWDPVGQGERSQFWDAARGRSRYNLICGEHAVLGNLACLAGTNLGRWEAWDGIRAVDYLLTRGEVDPRRIAVTGTSGGGFQAATIGALDDRIAVVAPSCYITSLPMRMANRTFEDPDSDPEQDPYGSVSGGVDHPGLLLLVHPRPLVVAAAVKDFVPIEGARRTFREIASIYRRFGGADRVAFVEGYHPHRFSDENQDAVFAFLDRLNGLPARHGFEPFTPLAAEALRCTASGQVRLDLEGDRPLTEIIREHFRSSRARATATLKDLYLADPYPGINAWPVVPGDRSAPAGTIAWESKGTTRVGGASVDRYLLRHSGGLEMPLLHVHPAATTSVEQGVSPARPARPVVLDVGLEGKTAAAGWIALRARLDAGFDVVSFDLRGTGETRMRYRAAGDDQELAPADESAAYANPLSSVLANHVYNSLLTGRPYFLEMLEDVEIAARFSRLRLGAPRILVAGTGDASLLARSAGEAVPGVESLPEPGARPFAWADAVESLAETWPIQYLLPGGALLRQPASSRR
jgi:photosystem II stability/assembly factor-like uncharacterized protein